MKNEGSNLLIYANKKELYNFEINEKLNFENKQKLLTTYEKEITKKIL